MTKNLVLKPRHFKKFVPKTRHLYIYLYKKNGIFFARTRIPRYNKHLAKSCSSYLRFTKTVV